ncbi:hypothetical protein CBR_g39783 [Chara braunii]|uniref:DUF4360 domain-containing protein n=1 Tax=Chara braunii TaxID=69332 RepID=A0A388LSC0_CHABU|nr:hypothetical protein CBR_g39783 [Chara braunii]|eukprot:GBG85217.1 hypothetical protein CBR_g39783 [Chara braunii]
MRTAPGAANWGGRYLLPSPEELICCWARGDKSKVRRKAWTKRIRHTVFESVSTMAAMVVVLFLGLLQLAVPGLAQSPPPGTVKIEGLTYAGDGCPPGSLDLAISPNGISSLGFTKFTVFTPGRPADRRKSCHVGVSLSYPAGFTFSVKNVAFRGSAQFGEVVKGGLRAGYYFVGFPGTVRSSRSLPPPVEGNFEFSDSFGTFAYAPCGSESASLNVFFEATVVPPPPPEKNNKALVVLKNKGSITVTSAGFGLLWKKC